MYLVIKKLGTGTHILSFVDSSIALIYIYQASFYPVKEELKDAVARWSG